MADLTIGVSSCLAGMPVRYDGRDKRDTFVTDTLASAARLVLVCPEVELGLGTPRETLQLVRAGAGVRMISASDRDITGEMAFFARERVERLAADDLDGYVLKSRSPSCGLGDAPVVDRDGNVPGRQVQAGHVGEAPAGEARARATTGDGLFAAALTQRWPHLPVTTERALADAGARAHFLACAAAYHELKAFFRGAWTVDALAAFHRERASAWLAVAEYARLERLIGEGAHLAPAELEHAYMAACMAAMRHVRPPAGSARAGLAEAD